MLLRILVTLLILLVLCDGQNNTTADDLLIYMINDSLSWSPMSPSGKLSSGELVTGRLADEEREREVTFKPQRPPDVVIHSDRRLSPATILDHLMVGYDGRERPRDDQGGPVVVTCDLYIRMISSINEISMQYTVDLLVRQRWRDPRLAYGYRQGYNYITADLATIGTVWKPDLFFANEKEGHLHNMTVPNILSRVYPDGDVQYNMRLTLVFMCQMWLEKYPFDEQLCEMLLGSFAYTDVDVRFVWKEPEPITRNVNLSLPQFKLSGIHTVSCYNIHYTGNFSCLKVVLRFEREFGYHMFQSYIPTVLLVICSWVSFWLDVDAIPARISLGVTTLLTIATQSSGIRTQLPRVSYTKAIDIWMGTCMSFVFVTLLEFALINYISRRGLVSPEEEEEEDTSYHHTVTPAPQGVTVTTVTNSTSTAPLVTECNNVEMQEYHVKPPVPTPTTSSPSPPSQTPAATRAARARTRRLLYRTRAKHIDISSRILFPILFLIFNIVYWTTFAM